VLSDINGKLSSKPFGMAEHLFVLKSNQNTFYSRFISRIFQRFRLVKFIEKFKTRVKNLKIEKIISFDKYSPKLFFAFYFHLSKTVCLTSKNYEVAGLTHFSTKCGCFYFF